MMAVPGQTHTPCPDHQIGRKRLYEKGLHAHRQSHPPPERATKDAGYQENRNNRRIGSGDSGKLIAHGPPGPGFALSQANALDKIEG